MSGSVLPAVCLPVCLSVDASPPVSVFGESVKACQVQVFSTLVESGHVVSTQRCQGSGFESRSSKSCPIMHKPWN